MLDWLKTILGDAYTDDIDKQVSQEIGKGFVSRVDFNAKNETVKKLEGQIADRDKQLEDLKKSAGSTDALKDEIAKLQEQNKNDKAKYDAEIASIKLNNAVETALTAAGAKNNTAVKALLAEFLKDAKTDEEGNVKGLDAAIKELAGAEGTSFLFKEAKNTGGSLSGMQPGDPGGKASSSSQDDYASRLSEARKSGNTAAAVAIKREAAENGVFLM